MSSLPSLALVVPLFDEVLLVEGVVADTVAALDAASVDFCLVLVDNGSTDGTSARVRGLACDPRVRAVHLSPNQGYGGGILAGLAEAWQVSIGGQPADVVGWMWGDGQIDPGTLPGLLSAIADGAELAKVRRSRRLDGSQRRVVSTAYAAVLRVLGLSTADVNGCPKLFPREVLVELDLRARDWFLDCEAVLAVEARGGRISDLPAVMRPRAAGHSKVGAATVAEFVYSLARWRVRGDAHGSRPAPRPVLGDLGDR